MGPALAGTIYGALGIIAAFIFRPRFGDTKTSARAAMFWLVSTPVLFLIPQSLAALVICAAILAILAPRGFDDRAAFYMMTLVAVPSAVAGVIPFPGLNHLFVLNFPEAACLVLLVPALILGKPPKAARYAPTIGIMVIILTILFSIQEFRSANLTSGLRATIENILHYALPFMALIRLAPTTASFEKIFSAFVFIAVIFFFSAVVSQVTSWNFYTFLTERHGVPTFADFRQGLLRVSVTVIPVLVGYVMTVGMIVVEYFRIRRKIGALMTWFYRGAFIAATVITVSRGAWLAMALGLLTFYFFAKAPRSVRSPLIALSILFLFPTAIYFTMTADLNTIDQYGSFEYRRELLRTSLEQVWARPFFGDPFYLDSGRFDHLYQGQGIIDVVNYYVQLMLEHGLVGLGLYLWAFGAAIFGLLSLGKFVRRDNARELELQRAVMLSAIAAYLVTMATVSAVSLASHFGIIILALSAAFIGAARAEYGAKPAPIVQGDLMADGLAAPGEGYAHG